MITPILVVSGAFAATSWFFSRWLRRVLTVPQRPQAAAICYRWKTPDRLEYLLVRTNNNRRWIFPKGAIEKGESPEQAAIREVREEAGVEGRITGSLDTFNHAGVQVSVRLFEVAPGDPPRKAERRFKWLEIDPAKQAIREHRSKKRASALLRALAAAHRQLTSTKNP